MLHFAVSYFIYAAVLRVTVRIAETEVHLDLLPEMDCWGLGYEQEGPCVHRFGFGPLGSVYWVTHFSTFPERTARALQQA